MEPELCFFTGRELGKFLPAPELQSLAGEVERELVSLLSEQERIYVPVLLVRRRDGSLQVLDGRHRIAAIRDRGEEKIPAVIYDEDFLLSGGKRRIEEVVAIITSLRRSPSLKERLLAFSSKIRPVGKEQPVQQRGTIQQRRKDGDGSVTERLRREIREIKEKYLEVVAERKHLLEQIEILETRLEEPSEPPEEAFKGATEEEIRRLEEQIMTLQEELQERERALARLRQEFSKELERELEALRSEYESRLKELEAQDKARESDEVDVENSLRQSGVPLDELPQDVVAALKSFFYRLESVRTVARQLPFLLADMETILDVCPDQKDFLLKEALDALGVLEASVKHTRAEVGSMVIKQQEGGER